jgi:hypothetical protein
MSMVTIIPASARQMIDMSIFDGHPFGAIWASAACPI